MSRSRLILDASPLILLAKIEALPLISALTHQILIPATVMAEVRAKAEPSFGSFLARDQVSIGEEIELPLLVAGWGLDPGESQVLAHAVRQSAGECVLDDREARRCAKALDLPVVGTLGLILRAKKRGLVPAARPLVVRLVREGAFLDAELVEGGLRLVGE